MKEIKGYTPGDWKLDGLTVNCFGRGIVAQIPIVSKGGVMECVKNAELIALAPNLYEENIKLREQVKSMYDLMEEMGMLITSDKWDEAFRDKFNPIMANAESLI